MIFRTHNPVWFQWNANKSSAGQLFAMQCICKNDRINENIWKQISEDLKADSKFSITYNLCVILLFCMKKW